MNKVIQVGNLTRDPEVKTAGSSEVANFAIAVNRWVKRGDERVKETDFFNCEAWGKTAELVGKLLSKGDKVLVDGELRQDTWESEGQKRSTIKIRVSTFDKLSWSDSPAPAAAEEVPAGEEIPF